MAVLARRSSFPSVPAGTYQVEIVPPTEIAMGKLTAGTIAGAADAAAYQTMLESIAYSNAASSPTAGVRTISVVVNDGVCASDAVFATITVE